MGGTLLLELLLLLLWLLLSLSPYPADYASPLTFVQSQSTGVLSMVSANHCSGRIGSNIYLFGTPSVPQDAAAAVLDREYRKDLHFAHVAPANCQINGSDSGISAPLLCLLLQS
jgi:hypothetical protein